AKTCAGPLQSILPTIDMSEPMQEAVPAFVVGSDLARAWSCGCAVLSMISATFAAAFLSFSGALLCMLFNISTSFISPARSTKRAKALVSRSSVSWRRAFDSHRMVLGSHLSAGMRKPSFNVPQIGLDGRKRGRLLHVFFLRTFGVDAGR